MPAHLTKHEEPLLTDWITRGVEPVEDWREVVITPPTHLVGELTVLDMGDRLVELAHLGRGHTDNDLLLHVPDAATWLVGDLLEESGPPMYGPDSFPLDWPGTIGLLRERLVASATLVPGHGAAVMPRFAAAQHAELQHVAALIRELHAAGVPAGQALAEGGDRWPYPREQLSSAVSRGYRQLATITPAGH
jgi:glyoxylase-like metal-dependent hydrolase (beta-lactamase superfamily II)